MRPGSVLIRQRFGSSVEMTSLAKETSRPLFRNEPKRSRVSALQRLPDCLVMLVIEQEFLGIEQRPEDVFEHRALLCLLHRVHFS